MVFTDQKVDNGKDKTSWILPFVIWIMITWHVWLLVILLTILLVGEHHIVRSLNFSFT